MTCTHSPQQNVVICDILQNCSIHNEEQLKPSEHPAVTALDSLTRTFGQTWPPRASFDNWPSSWLVYQTICDKMPEALHHLDNAERFRVLMQQQLSGQVNLEEVIEDLEIHLVGSVDSDVLGLLAVLSCLVLIYSAGTIPPSKKTAHHTIPTQVWLPFTKIHDFLGMMSRCTILGLILSNTVYDPKTNQPSHVRFHFNHQPEQRKQKTAFFLGSTAVEHCFSPGLACIKEYLTTTETAHHCNNRTHIHRLLKKRHQLLTQLHAIVKSSLKLFYKYINEKLISVETFEENILQVLGSGPNQSAGGVSASELMVLNTLDEFLGVSGKATIYQSTLSKRAGMPKQCRQVLDALREHGRDYRFDSFLETGTTEDDPLIRTRDDIIHSMFIFRLGHAKRISRFLMNSKTTVGGGVDKGSSMPGYLHERVEAELRVRALETLQNKSTGTLGMSYKQNK